jgi:methyl-accepting chemotaxis protein
MFNNMKIGLRLALGFCLVIGFMIAIIVVSINQMTESRYMLDRIVKVNNVRVQLANNMIDNVREVSIALRTALLLKDTEKTKQTRDKIAETRKEYDENLRKVGELTPRDDAKALEIISKVKASEEKSRTLNNAVFDLAASGKHDAALDLMIAKASPTVGQWIEVIDDLIHYNEKRIASRYDEATIVQENARKSMFILGAAAIALALMIAVFLTLGITRPLKTSVDAANMIASKDLTIDLSKYKKRRDEIGVMMQAFGRMIVMMREQIQGILEGVNTITSSSSEILAATTQVASGSAENASAISETTTTVEEVRQAAELSSQKAKIMSDSSQRVAKVSQSGRKAVEDTSSGMLHIREQMDSIAQTIVRLSEQGQSIGGIIASVTDIADQSNLLAVNAAIEATRAGEQGKAFAVVAQEIKSLAEQSKQATMQVRTILNDVQKATSAAVMATEQGSKAVEAGVKQSAQAGEAIRVLAESSNEAVQTATQIVASSQQQVVGMNQIGTAMENINQAGAETAASMKQAETAAKNLHELGQKLKGLVEQFKA